MNNRNIVKQDFALVNARYKLSPLENKFVLIAIAQINADDKDFREYTISIKEFEQKTGKEQNENDLKNFSKRLLSKPLEIATPKGWQLFNWFSMIEFDREERVFKCNIHPTLKPYLLELRERFVKTSLKYILTLQSSYAIRLYTLLKEFEKVGKRYMSVKELMDIMQVPESYKRYSQFKQKVLDYAQKELKENTDISFTYREEKNGRKVEKILFLIHSNKIEAESLFQIDDNEYETYIGEQIITGKNQDVVNIRLITPFSDGSLRVEFSSGEFSVVPNRAMLDKAIMTAKKNR